MHQDAGKKRSCSDSVAERLVSQRCHLAMVAMPHDGGRLVDQPMVQYDPEERRQVVPAAGEGPNPDRRVETSEAPQDLRIESHVRARAQPSGGEWKERVIGPVMAGVEDSQPKPLVEAAVSLEQELGGGVELCGQNEAGDTADLRVGRETLGDCGQPIPIDD